MNAFRMTVIHWLLALLLLWPAGCSLIPSIVPLEKPPPPVPRKVQPPQATGSAPVIPEAPPAADHFTHEIKWAGENLILIARWYTGDGNNWLRLVDANPSIDPRRIKIGDSILIPVSLLKTREPMPISVISRRPAIQKNPPAPSAAPAPPPQEVELFGPIDTGTLSDRLQTTGSPPQLESIE